MIMMMNPMLQPLLATTLLLSKDEEDINLKIDSLVSQ
jgi:hypothetical protein